MAIGSSNIKRISSNSQDALLRQLMEEYGRQTTPKVGGLQRLLAPLTGIGSGIDAYHDARFEQGDSGLLNVLKNYGQNILQGFGTLASGTNYEDIEGASALLDKLNPGYKNSAIGGSAVGRIGVDIAAGLLTDPTTYFSFGAASLADDVIKGGLRAAGLSAKGAKKLLPKLSGSTLTDANKILVKELGADIADKFYVNIMQNVGKSTAKSGALKLLGETISESKPVVKGAKALISPLGGAMDALDWGSKKFTPGLRANLLDTFDPVQGAIEGGHGAQAANFLKFNRESSSIYMGILGELRDADLLETFNKLGDDEKAKMAKLIEATKETAFTSFQAGELIKIKPEIIKALKEYAGSRRDIIYESLDEDQKPLLDPLLNKIKELGGEPVTDKQLSKLFDNTIGNYTDKTGQLLSIPEGVSEEGKTFLSRYFEFERGKINRMKELGLPTLDPKQMGYISRMPAGYRQKALKSTLKNAGMEDTYNKILDNKFVKRDLEKFKYVKRETLQSVLNENELEAFKRYDPGMLGEMISGGGATKARKYLTREQAEAAGIVYGDNPLEEIYTQSVRQEEQILAADFAQRMVQDEEAFSKVAKGKMRTPVTVPGVGTYYTDKHMAKIAEDYIQKYTTEEGINKLLSGFDQIQRTWKKWVTGMGPNAPAYHLRNLLDDNIRLIVDGADITKLPGDYMIAMDIFKYEDLMNKVGKEEALKQIDQSRAAKFLKEVGIKADNPLEELWQRSIKSGTYSDVSKSVTEMHMGKPREVVKAIGLDKKEGAIDKAQSGAEDIMTLGGKLPQREQATRMATYFNNWRKEGVESAGIDAVQRVNFNYNELTKVEKEVFRRVIPFYGFVKNNLRFYMDMLKDNPEKLGRFYNVYEGLQSGSQSKYGEDWEAMPDYVKNTLSIPFGESKDGELKYLTGMNLGIENLNDLPIGEEGLRNAAGNLSPELGMILELMSGKEFFRGEDIVEGNQGYNYENRSELLKKLMNYQKYPVQLKDGREYEKQTVSPTFRYFLENTPFLSTVNTFAGRAASVKDKGKAAENLTNMFFPGRINIGRVDDAKERIKRKQEEDLYKLLQKKGLADVYRSFYIPEGLREQLLK